MKNVFFLLLCASWVMQAQTIRPDLRNPTYWTASGIQPEPCIINGCDHVVSFCNFPMFWESIRTFINSGKLP